MEAYTLTYQMGSHLEAVYDCIPVAPSGVSIFKLNSNLSLFRCWKLRGQQPWISKIELIFFKVYIIIMYTMSISLFQLDYAVIMEHKLIRHMSITSFIKVS